MRSNDGNEARPHTGSRSGVSANRLSKKHPDGSVPRIDWSPRAATSPKLVSRALAAAVLAGSVASGAAAPRSGGRLCFAAPAKVLQR